MTNNKVHTHFDFAKLTERERYKIHDWELFEEESLRLERASDMN